MMLTTESEDEWKCLVLHSAAGQGRLVAVKEGQTRTMDSQGLPLVSR